MSEIAIPILFYSSLAGLATITGVFLMRQYQAWALDHSHYINSFAAGLILALVFFHLMPEAVELSDIAFPAILIGFFLFFLLENFIVIHSGSEIHYCIDDEETVSGSGSHLTRMGIMAFFGLAFHSLIDGIIIGVGFEIDMTIGFLAAVAVIMHEVPEGITTFALINRAMPEKANVFSIIVAIATPVGALVSLFFIGGLTDEIIGILLALAAGTFIYVAASDLIPETHEKTNFQNLVTFILGAIFIYVISGLESFI
ncbi:MAG: ZIP family metal transporter [Candidatus Heimdallarchaeota archaeon]|nr:MAG: ZIP family metal transporter [Candidatus Heimdallarchaeota archaeon]